MEHVDVLIVGAGISGIGMGCHLRMKNPDKTFTILEGREAIGGTWDLFRYPGIRSDSDMYTFGYSFKPWKDDQDIATADAILRYLNETVDEYDLRDEIRFGHFVKRVRWSSADRQWVATVAHGDETFEISSDFLVTCTGYYDYEQGHLPKFEGFDRYEGEVAHPQHWPEDLDYADKRVLVIGSGATAVTIVPSMADDAAHVTMLQRSPTYIFSRPGEDKIAKGLKAVLPERVAHGLARVKNVTLGTFVWNLSKRRPDKVRALLRDMAVEALGPDYDVDTHFNPSYDPWDQRLCLIPDGDLYESIAKGDASVVTDTIDHFTETGVVLSSGETLEADVVVPATGLSLKFLGGMEMELDGEPVVPADLVSYRGLMFGGVPNWVAVVGYTNASWTLKSDLASDFVCRVLSRMDEGGFDTVVPRAEDVGETRTIMDNLKSGYVRRAADRMPKQGTRDPWRNSDNYIRDLLRSKLGRLEDGVLEFTKAPHRTDRMTLKGKTAVITGAASGIGEGLAMKLAGRGAHLILVDRDAENLARVADAARTRRVNVETHVVDMGDADAVERLGAEIATEHPEIDLLFNNAGVALGGEVIDATRRDVEWLMNINFWGVVHLTRALLPTLLARPDAHIATTSSVFGLIGPPGQAAYSASKFAVRGWCEALRRELSDTSVGVSVIHPGGIKTKIARNARLAEGIEGADISKEIVEFEKHLRTSADDAASIILKGIEERRPRILVGADAHLIAALERVFPTTAVEVLAKITGLKSPSASRVRQRARALKARAAAAPRIEGTGSDRTILA